MSASPTRRRLALLAAAATGVQVGAAMVATRPLLRELGPATLACLRYALALACLLAWVRPAALRPLRRWPWREMAAVAALGVLQFGLLIALLNAGLRTVTAGLGALLFTTFPVLTLVVAASLGREPWSGRALLGMGLAVAGVGVALGVGWADVPGGAGAGVGVACVLAAALCGAVCSVLYRPLLQRHPSRLVAVVAMSASVLVLAPAALLEGMGTALPALSATGWGWLAFIGVSSGVGYALWLWALSELPATRVTIFLALAPLTAMALGAAWLGEPLGWAAGAGLALVLAGLAVTLRPAPAAAGA